MCNSLVDEVHGPRLELLGGAQAGEDEDLRGVLRSGAQSVLAHQLQPLQSVLPVAGRARSNSS